MGDPALFVELLLIATIVAILVQHVRLPYTLALVLAGVAVGLALQVPELPVDPHLWLLLFLPPLLFEGTINMDLEVLRRYATPVGTLALLGTLIQVTLLSAAFHYLLGFPLVLATLLGVILSPTDPVSVLSLFKEHGASRGLQTIVEGESVFNDGIAVVLYLIVLQLLSGEAVTVMGGTIEFVKVVAGGGLVGIVLGYLTHRLYSVIDDHLIEVGLSVVLAYGSFLVAERLEVSGVIAVVVAGLIIGNYGRIFSMSPSTRLSLKHFWEVGAFLINGLLFLLIGLSVERGQLLEGAGEIAIVFAIMAVGRGLAVYGLLSGYKALADRFFPGAWIHAVNWAGLRGSIPVALALGLPADVPQLARLKTITLGAVFLSLMVQGLTIKPLMSRLGLLRRTSEQEEFERAQGQAMAARAALSELEVLNQRGEISERLYRKLNRYFERKRAEATATLGLMTEDYGAVRRRQLGRVSTQLFAAERAALNEALRRGLLSEEVWGELKQDVDARLVEGEEVGWEQLWQEESVDLDEDTSPGQRPDDDRYS
ncbi:MAG: Na+/H+ antiporter [Gemmatimonadetes bacterium]|uniref:Na+/H+ antiporter n=1 Tax=Candidatus Kutchimonas denitrificans TaxID=3056748 RepID=A0AAE4Z7N3_9BACT|nr:Na+/H+ antiporter [Gemmatimonadota bacterium]NIR75320.1 Na+/H+ antiporter [Candidatus Kutchimonas denitrificans]NIS02146.1 Na+/H+ antiporter [Gemmatimonadota bacterium]NIT67971.1 Na+/H+ antiporter [Gemmatimonadota bacterium]NIU53965.1 Na+/H+ antiporter [Gemmatimonadota bacterium]